MLRLKSLSQPVGGILRSYSRAFSSTGDKVYANAADAVADIPDGAKL